VRQPEIRPDQILDAAERVLLARGDGAMTMDAVAADARVGKGTLYHYYASKAEVLAAIRARWVERTVTAAAETATSGRPRSVLRQMERFFAAVLDNTERDSALIWIVFHTCATEERDDLAGVYAYLLDVVREGIAAGEFEVADPELVTQFLLDGFHGVMESSIERGGLDATRINRFMRTILRALLTPQPPGRERRRRDDTESAGSCRSRGPEVRVSASTGARP
jgi:AcrR family transcriptional regulator